MARVIEFYIPQDFKTDGAMGAAGSTRKGSRVPQHCSEEVSLNCSGAKDDVRGSQGRGGAAC
ncbi:MAG TPA: hypothetical protein VMB70_04580 [Terriglobia bacterium]|jgi:hypothetical protein|nr:hypothetical protein [Terriglobia bacterium]